MGSRNVDQLSVSDPISDRPGFDPIDLSGLYRAKLVNT